MKEPYVLTARPCRFCGIYGAGDPQIPAELYSGQSEAPDLSGFPLPLPSKKSDYTCSAVTDDGVMWYGASTGLTRYDPAADRGDDLIMYFSADRDLPDNNVRALLAKDGGLWALTETGAAFIEMKMIGAEEKALMLLEETLKYVDRHGMVSQKHLEIPGDVASAVKYGHSDNDGGFTAEFCIGEMYRYAVYKREKGTDHPDTLAAKKVAARALEACLLLFHISGRGDGFLARSYLCPGEPVPDDGLFFRKEGGKATCIETRQSKRVGIAGKVIDASAPVPDRLAKLYRDAGYSDDGIVYKGDTSSDETTLHIMNMIVSHDIIGEDDPELDELIKISLRGLMNHILDHGYELHDCTGKPTTWAKWSGQYFVSEVGYVDACLNAAEILMYLKAAMHITGEQGRWREEYDKLIAMGYADLTEKHFDRQHQAGLSLCVEPVEDIMFGDHALATKAYFGLCMLEKDEGLLKKYRNGYKSWRTTIRREYNPGYDLPFKLACPDEEIDMEMMATWLYRTNVSRLASGVSFMGRHDTPVQKQRAGKLESSWMPPSDERFISKYDRDPVEYRNVDSGGMTCVESCYVYTHAYWMGRYYGFFN
ncbi:MAG: hypothetical protein FWF05_01855 [Oscillospiraceae bacterium]|nr:hypothetical protein [Oscillospiraceae bacterium]